jgi:hypothetical protein
MAGGAVRLPQMSPVVKSRVEATKRRKGLGSGICVTDRADRPAGLSELIGMATCAGRMTGTFNTRRIVRALVAEQARRLLMGGVGMAKLRCGGLWR